MIKFKYFVIEEDQKGKLFGLKMKEGIDEVSLYFRSILKRWYWEGHILTSFVKNNKGLTYFKVLNANKEIYDYDYKSEGSIEDFTGSHEPIIKINSHEVEIVPAKEIPSDDLNYEMY